VGVVLNLLAVKTKATAKEAQTLGDAVKVGSDGKWTLAKSDAIANANAVALVADVSIAQNAVGGYVLNGQITNDSWNWTVGSLIYLSTTGTTGNTLTQIAPFGANNVIQILGVATSAHEMIFAPQLVQVEHV
jgi:hypothetical protein